MNGNVSSGYLFGLVLICFYQIERTAEQEDVCNGHFDRRGQISEFSQLYEHRRHVNLEGRITNWINYSPQPAQIMGL